MNYMTKYHRFLLSTYKGSYYNSLLIIFSHNNSVNMSKLECDFTSPHVEKKSTGNFRAPRKTTRILIKLLYGDPELESILGVR